MGRTLKRVPLDFDWPHSQVWEGYLNPYYTMRSACVSCEGSGYSSEAKRFQDEWYGHAPFDPIAYGAGPLDPDDPKIETLAKRNVECSPQYYGSGAYAILKEQQRLFDLFSKRWCHQLSQADVDALTDNQRLMEFTHRPRTPEQAEALAKKGGYWMTESNGYRPTAEEVNSFYLVGLGHDAINASICIQARCEREGVPLLCSRCEGAGHTWPSEEIKKAYEDWTETEPPEGPGFQLWETTSEGSPISPVFETLDDLCAWCEVNASTFAHGTATKEKWKTMLEADNVYHQEGNFIHI